MGDLGVSLARFLSWSSDLPRRASCSFWNLRFARRCWGVCACRDLESVVVKEAEDVLMASVPLCEMYVSSVEGSPRRTGGR
jgi:hypothetical protein